eukprot:scaffold228408_cov56-Cyclotella_meneghiniana.AAC.1
MNIPDDDGNDNDGAPSADDYTSEKDDLIDLTDDDDQDDLTSTNHPTRTSDDLLASSAAYRTLPSAYSGPTPAEPSTMDDDANKN